MHPYAWAWIVVAAMVPLALFALGQATRGWNAPRTKRLAGALLAVWALLPAPVPGYPGSYAPAFLVFVFEAVFQNPGAPGTAGLILAAGTAATLGLTLLVGSLKRRRRGD